MKKLNFIICTEYGELLDLAIHLKYVEKHNVLLHVFEKDYQKIGDGIIPKVAEIFGFLGKGYIWVIDGCAHGKLQDLFRAQGELVFGGSEIGDKLENERQANQKWFAEAGFKQPESQNFKSLDDALTFVKENSDRRWILKQNGDAPKSLNHMGKFDDSSDMIYHLEELKKGWNEQEFGKIDFDLMEVVEGIEVAASAFFNGTDFLKNKAGKVVGFLNFEEKKECDGGVGETTGEMGTTFLGVTEDSPLFKEIIMKPKILSVLRKSKFRGVFDINCIKTEEGLVALEPTCRPGVPSTSYEFMEGLDSPTGEMIEAVANGTNTPIEVKQGYGMVMVIAAKPYPSEADMDSEATSLGEKLWILKDGKPAKEFDKEQLKHIHLENFERSEEEGKEGVDYKVATKNGYLLTVTAFGKSIGEVRDNLIEYIKSNVYISGMKYRHDIGKRIEKESKKEEKDTVAEDKIKVKQQLEDMKAVKEYLKELIFNI